jgi:ribose 5-phosphate isomerase B
MATPLLIASDHVGFALKEALKVLLPDVIWEDLGPATDARSDYPDFAEKLGLRISEDPAGRGILICSSGIGMSIAANKIAGVRAAVVENPVAARLARQHNDANVLCLGARFTAPEYACELVVAFLDAAFSPSDGGGRHAARIAKITALERPVK